VAEAFAKHKGSLRIKNLATLSVEAARALAKHEGHLGISNLATISEEAAQALRSNPDISFPDRANSIDRAPPEIPESL
jgi:hypothetical protein